jgi:hypothetical protein
MQRVGRFGFGTKGFMAMFMVKGAFTKTKVFKDHKCCDLVVKHVLYMLVLLVKSFVISLSSCGS